MPKLARNRLLWAATTALWVGSSAPALADHLAPSAGKALRARPTVLGVSGSSQTFLLVKNRLYCYAGTLGSLVEDGTRQYVLSNNHVLAKENEQLAYGPPAANGTIIQPGSLDEGSCSLSSGDPSHAVADLSSFVPILFGKGRDKPSNSVDAALAAVRSGQVGADGSILGIGVVGGAAAAAVGMPVQKTGRTTGHTFGTVRAVGVTIDVSYDSGTARFVDQIRVRRPCDDDGFSAAGDSGSLVVTAPAPGSEPQAVGLLFAGGGSDTFANPIAEVLASTGTRMVTGRDGDTADAMLADHQQIASACPSGGGGGGGPPGGRPPGLSIALDAAARHSDQIFALPAVVGHGVGASERGEAVIEIYVARRGRGFPDAIEGVPVRVIETGRIRAY